MGLQRFHTRQAREKYILVKWGLGRWGVAMVLFARADVVAQENGETRSASEGRERGRTASTYTFLMRTRSGFVKDKRIL